MGLQSAHGGYAMVLAHVLTFGIVCSLGIYLSELSYWKTWKFWRIHDVRVSHRGRKPNRTVVLTHTALLWAHGQQPHRPTFPYPEPLAQHGEGSALSSSQQKYRMWTRKSQILRRLPILSPYRSAKEHIVSQPDIFFPKNIYVFVDDSSERKHKANVG